MGERWTLLLVRDLLLGPRRYGDLLGAMPGLTTNLLANRLAAMVENGILEKVKLPPPSGATVYQLTELGRELEPVVLALGRFGARWLAKPGPDDVVNPRWAMVSLKRRFVPREGLAGTLELQIDDDIFQARFDASTIEVRDGPALEPDGSLRGRREGWFPLFGGRASLQELVAAGQLERSGSAKLVSGFVRAIGLRAA